MRRRFLYRKVFFYIYRMLLQRRAVEGVFGGLFWLFYQLVQVLFVGSFLLQFRMVQGVIKFVFLVDGIFFSRRESQVGFGVVGIFRELGIYKYICEQGRVMNIYEVGGSQGIWGQEFDLGFCGLKQFLDFYSVQGGI